MKEKSIAFVILMRANISEKLEKRTPKKSTNLRPSMLKLVFGLSVFTLFGSAFGQRQVILMAGDEVVHRFKKGDSFRVKLVDNKTEYWGFLTEINEFSVITSRDTIGIRKIRKVLLPGKPKIHRLGIKLITAGVGLFIIDQLNYGVLQGNDPNIDSGVAIASIAIVTAAVPMALTKKNWAKPKGRLRLISVGRDSRFYEPAL
jgi:hypothetical protein